MKADYTDTYTVIIRNTHRMTAKDLFQLMFIYYPKPILYMLKLRNWLVKSFGLQGGERFTELIREENEEKITLGKSDKHLEFHVLLQCDMPDARTLNQSIRITTIVKYHNSLGKIYFFFIRPFHILICKELLKRAARKWEKGKFNQCRQE